MYYRNELFYRLHSVGPSDRARLYHYACKLAHQSSVVVTASAERYSIWINLRSPGITSDILGQQSLFQFIQVMQHRLTDPENHSDNHPESHSESHDQIETSE